MKKKTDTTEIVIEALSRLLGAFVDPKTEEFYPVGFCLTAKQTRAFKKASETLDQMLRP